MRASSALYPERVARQGQDRAGIKDGEHRSNSLIFDPVVHKLEGVTP